MWPFPALLALCLTTRTFHVSAAVPGTFEDGGNTLVSAMMLFLGNTDKVYILDKAEMNAAQVNGHPAWGAVWDIASRKAAVMDVRTNSFCSSGLHLPNGSYVTFGGNGAVGPGGTIGSQPNPGGYSASWDSTIQDFDGTKSIRVLNPCTNSDSFSSSACQWYDDPSVLSMKKNRWYSAAEATAEGRVVIIGGFANGGYVNRNYPNDDPAYGHNASEPTYEYYPPVDSTPQVFQFLVSTSGLNAYVHTFLMPSGKMFVQANLSTVLWDHTTNEETPLPSMPNGVARIYPASGATAMLPLTPANNYTPSILFCGGSDMPEYAYGNYTFPFINTWEHPASRDCHRITPEPQDGSPPAYVADDDMLETRTMGQFIILPTGQLLVINGALNGTAGFSTSTLTTPSFANMPYGESLASGPVLTPSIYNPDAPTGNRWSKDGLHASTIPRMYHSSAILLPDASVLIAGSNPNIEVNFSTIYPTTYTAEVFYPPYFNVTTRPAPTGMPKTLGYGGDYFDILVAATSYSGSANDAADSTKVVIVRPGFTTHAMNMGQRYMQLNNTYTVNSNGSIILHVAQPPPNPNLFQPGPALMFVNVHGVPSVGSYVIVGNGQIGTQATQSAALLPASIPLANVTGTSNSNDGVVKRSNIGIIVGVTIGVLALLAMMGVIFGLIRNRKGRRGGGRPRRRGRSISKSARKDVALGMLPVDRTGSDSFVPLQNKDIYPEKSFVDMDNRRTTELFPHLGREYYSAQRTYVGGGYQLR